jgi:hypothetical protein
MLRLTECRLEPIRAVDVSDDMRGGFVRCEDVRNGGRITFQGYSKEVAFAFVLRTSFRPCPCRKGNEVSRLCLYDEGDDLTGHVGCVVGYIGWMNAWGCRSLA